MNTLHHKDRIRLEGWNQVTSATVSTIRGYGEDCGYDAERIAKLLAQAVERKESEVGSIYTGATLDATGNAFREDKANAARAVTLTNNELVQIERGIYRVKVMHGCDKSPRYSDPIHFIHVGNI